MLLIPTSAWAHAAGTLTAWMAGALSFWWQYRVEPQTGRNDSRLRPESSYYQTLALGALLGAWLVGTVNTMPMGLAPAHSVAGALVGGIISVEVWKWRHGIRGSTGSSFVLPLTVGIMVGRIGCLFSGLADFTYGVPSQVPWAVDLGDGIGRHPVQAYESLAMALFLMVWLPARHRQMRWATHKAFYAFVIFYFLQRFAWEFLKPYPKFIGPFNVFQPISLGMIVYGIICWRQSGTT